MKHLIIPSIFVPIALVLLIGICTANAQRTRLDQLWFAEFRIYSPLTLQNC